MNPLDVIGSATSFAKDIVDRIWPKKMTEEEKANAALEVQKLIEDRDSQLAGMSRDIIVAELQQGDNFTKRMRPTVGYTGLFVIVFNYVFVPFLNRILEWVAIAHNNTATLSLYALKPVDLPEAFWVVWGGVMAVYSIGRSAQLAGGSSRVYEWITGAKNGNGNGKK